MAPPDRQGSFTNTAIWSCTLLAIAALTVWKFEIWPIAGISTETGTLDPKQVATESIAVAPITIAPTGDAADSTPVIVKVDSTSDEAPPPAELAKLDIPGTLPAIPQSRASDWNREPPPFPPADSPGKLDPAPQCLPTGADFGANGDFPQAKQPPTAPPEQLAPLPTAAPSLQPIGRDEDAANSSQNPFLDTIAATDADSVTPVGTALFESEAPADPRLAVIDADIADNRYLAAHRALSKIYWDEPNLRSEIQGRIEKTAASIYFDPQPHYMPAHTSGPDEQLSQIAQAYNLTSEYLTRLNQLHDPHVPRPGRELKVVKGPFAAVVNVTNRTLTLHAHGYYVRAFPCEIAPSDSSSAGTFQILSEDAEWIALDDGHGNPSSRGIQTADPSKSGDPPPPGTIRLSATDAGITRDLLAPGNKISIRE